jgi:protein SCO1/2
MRIGLAAAGLAVVVGVAALVLALSSRSSGSVVLRGTAIQGEPAAPDFHLVDQDGKRVGLGGERGGVVLVTFLYTHCPDVCPLIAERLNAALPALGPHAHVLAVSVDPKGDTAAAVRSYVKAKRLRPGFRYLRGSYAQLAPVWKAWYVSAIPDAKVIDHVAMTVLVDAKGRQRVRYDASATAADIEHDVQALHL